MHILGIYQGCCSCLICVKGPYPEQHHFPNEIKPLDTVGQHILKNPSARSLTPYARQVRAAVNKANP